LDDIVSALAVREPDLGDVQRFEERYSLCEAVVVADENPRGSDAATVGGTS